MQLLSTAAPPTAQESRAARQTKKIGGGLMAGVPSAGGRNHG